MKSISKSLISLSYLFIVSCSEIGNKRTIDLLNNKNIDNKSIEKIQQEYGGYSIKWNDKKGNTVYSYSYRKGHYTFPLYFPFIIGYFGSIITEDYEVVLSYDSNGNFIDKQNFYNKVKSSTLLSCSKWSKDCIKKVY